MADDSPRQTLALKLGVATAASIIAAAIYGWRRRRQTGAGKAPEGVVRSITIVRGRSQLYDAWLSMLPQVMESFAAVSVDGVHVHWKFHSPAAQSYDTIVDRKQNGNAIRWAQADPATRLFSGGVEFKDAPGDRGTEVALRLATPDMHQAALGLALTHALRRFKSLIETGELPSLERNPAGDRGWFAKVVK